MRFRTALRHRDVRRRATRGRCCRRQRSQSKKTVGAGSNSRTPNACTGSKMGMAEGSRKCSRLPHPERSRINRDCQCVIHQHFVDHWRPLATVHCLSSLHGAQEGSESKRGVRLSLTGSRGTNGTQEADQPPRDSGNLQGHVIRKFMM